MGGIFQRKPKKQVPKHVFPDTGYLIKFIKSETDSKAWLESLKRKGANVHFTKAVLDELKNNKGVIFEGVKNPKERKALEKAFQEFMDTITVAAQLNNNVYLWDERPPNSFIEKLGKVMKENNGKGNSRVGLGEASIFHTIMELGIEEPVEIPSGDSDVGYLAKGLGLNNVNVTYAYA